MNSLSHVHRKDIESIKNDLKDFKCPSCSSSNVQEQKWEEKVDSTSLNMKPIGIIRTVFPEKRAVPRQANIAETILSRVELCKDLYTNPEQCLESLGDYTHFWILFHFHKNDPHKKPMIAPPRLDGKKVGVFATRSPHRPNPIGMSLVRLNKIEGSSIYFHGSDMVDETPVIDIKPYIPSYDSPQKLQDMNMSSPTNVSRSYRGEPEGEEEEEAEAASSSSVEPKTKTETDVKVPNWVSNKNLLKVIFSDNAIEQIAQLGVNQTSIEKILENDPRSVYVREKYLSQIYNFQLSGNNVICKFDDKQRTVNVLQIRKLLNMTQ